MKRRKRYLKATIKRRTNNEGWYPRIIVQMTMTYYGVVYFEYGENLSAPMTREDEIALENRLIQLAQDKAQELGFDGSDINWFG